MAPLVSNAILRILDERLTEHEIRTWISAENLPDVVVMADIPDQGIPEQGIPPPHEVGLPPTGT